MKPVVIDLKKITLRQGTTLILDKVSLQIKSGEHVVISGDSGAGKSSILNFLAGFMAAESGTAYCAGNKISSQQPSPLARSITYLGQEPFLPALSVEKALFQPLNYRANRHLAKPTTAELKFFFEILELEQTILKQPCNKLSGGQKQRIAILRTIILKRPIILADEPSSALPKHLNPRVKKMLRNEGGTLISVSHDPNWINLADQHLMLQNHQLKVVTNHG